MRDLPERQATGLIGAGLLAVGLAMVWMNAQVVAALPALAGCVLIVYAVTWERFQSFGPRGLVLQAFKERIERSLRVGAKDSLTISDHAETKVYKNERARAAAENIGGAGSLDDLADRIAEELTREETRFEHQRRVEKDERLRKQMSGWLRTK